MLDRSVEKVEEAEKRRESNLASNRNHQESRIQHHDFNENEKPNIIYLLALSRVIVNIKCSNGSGQLSNEIPLLFLLDFLSVLNSTVSL